jgi:hypothetical protein
LKKRRHFLHVPYVIVGLRSLKGADSYRDALGEYSQGIFIRSITASLLLFSNPSVAFPLNPYK